MSDDHQAGYNNPSNHTSLVAPSFLDLPDDVIDELFLFCDIRCVGRLSMSSRRFSFFFSQANRNHWKTRLCWLLGAPFVKEEDVVVDGEKETNNICKLLRITLKEIPYGLLRQKHPKLSWIKGREISVHSIGWNTYKISKTDTHGNIGGVGDDVCAFCNFHGIPRRQTTFIRRKKNDRKLHIAMSSIWYFESRLIKGSYAGVNTTPLFGFPDSCVAIGLCTEDFPTRGYQPGWNGGSIGYHSVDGTIFHKGRELPYGPTFGENDVIGCGMHIPSRSVFFTKNGKFIGTAFSLIDSPLGRTKSNNKPLVPVIGLDSNEFDVVVNFGNDNPFEFDVAAAARLYQQYPPRQNIIVNNSAGNNSPKEREALTNYLNDCTYLGKSNRDYHPWTGFTKRVRITNDVYEY